MPTVRVHTTLGPDMLGLPELAPLLGQEVHITVVPARQVEVPPVATAFVEWCKAYVAAHGPVTLEDAWEATAGVTGSLYDPEDD